MPHYFQPPFGRIPRTRRLLTAFVGSVVLLLLACEGWSALPTAHAPRWACPSPTPIPTRIKSSRARPTTTPGVDPGREKVYYQTWEQEYGLPPRTPTPYTKADDFFLGQRVEVAPLHVLLSARSGALIGDQQVQIVHIEWRNSSPAPVPMDYLNRVRVRAVRSATTNAIVTSDTWGTSDAALVASDLVAPPAEISPGNSVVELPILTPAGAVEIVDVSFLRQIPASTPTPATNHEAAASQFETVQWTRGSQQPPCDDPGAVTNYGDGPQSVPDRPAPPGTDRVIQIALQQVGKPYIWGAKGPYAFDCSGLTEWSYAQVGIDIPTGTSGQWPGLPTPTGDALRSGDLLFFDTVANGVPEITHVGLVSDLDGDGDWDMVHAASPEYGVRIDEDVFSRPYYQSRYMGARTVRR